MTVTMVLLLVSVLVAAVAAWPLARFAARRSAAQPIDVDLEAERQLVATVLAAPALFPTVAVLDADAFATPGLRLAWQLVHDLCPGMAPDETLTAETADAWFTARGAEMPADLRDRLLAADPTLTATLDALSAVTVLEASGLQSVGEKVRNDAHSRSLDGAVPVAYGDGLNAPVASRVLAPVTRGRIAATFALLAVGLTAAVAGPLAGTCTVPLAVALGVLALVVLAVGSVLWALVDHDTLFIDLATFWPVTAAAWVLAVGAAYLSGDLSRLLLGVVCTLVIGAIFVAGSLLFALVRGQVGMGGGDAILLIATIGVPVAVSGHWMVAYASVMAAMLLSVGWTLVARRRNAQAPFAFGPFLAVGWMVAVLLEAANLLPW